MKKENLVIIAAIVIIGYFVLTNKSNKIVVYSNSDKKIITDAGYPESIDVSKVKIQQQSYDIIAPTSYYGKFLISPFYDQNLKKDVYTLNNGSLGGATPFYDANTGELLGYSYLVSGQIKNVYFNQSTTPQQAQPAIADNGNALLSFGGGGGVTGSANTSYLYQNGVITDSNKKQLRKLSAIDLAFVIANLGLLKTYKYSKPDNMYQFITTGDNTITWGFETSGNNMVDMVYGILSGDNNVLMTFDI